AVVGAAPLAAPRAALWVGAWARPFPFPGTAPLAAPRAALWVGASARPFPVRGIALSAALRAASVQPEPSALPRAGAAEVASVAAELPLAEAAWGAEVLLQAVAAEVWDGVALPQEAAAEVPGGVAVPQ